MSTDFNAMGIMPELTERLQNDGIVKPTPVQEKAIPALLAGQDMIAQAQTGTGKTIAFALPILQRIDVTKDQVQALILTPTRELAIQITAEMAKLAPAVGAKVLAAYGGQDVVAQIRKLNNAPHIVVATPGRLIDHMKRETINLGKLRMLVLDEADQMLHMGFLPEVESIVVQTPKARQTMLFSATMPEAIKRLAENYMKTPVDIRIKSTNVTLDSIKQIVLETTDRGRQGALIELLSQYRPYLAVVFCRTKVRAKKLNEALQDAGFASDELHGDLTQAKREQVMKRFRDARLQILVATDVAARGLDVEGVTHVFNFDVPQDSETYIHRIGRTGRAGQNGVAITLASPYDRGAVQHIERGINASLDRRAIDSEGRIISGSRVQRTDDEGARGGRSANTNRGASRGRASSATASDGRGKRGGDRSGGRQEQRGGDRNGSRQEQRGGDRNGSRQEQRGGRGAAGKPVKAGARAAAGNPWEDTAAPAERGAAGRSRGKGPRTGSAPDGPSSWGGRKTEGRSNDAGRGNSGRSQSGGRGGNRGAGSGSSSRPQGSRSSKPGGGRGRGRS
ncbi:DEAD/DEAH box helicase [Paenibacillus sp. NPDC058071]|uniref:DEAD/DEAH box helicase n=1 Tax=Paenibacillus sp. NPDC058071 TaxID=3346326 RepID=UPI0036DDF5DA